ncbi:MAG: GNAT family N-acetyltransferase [Firmicutes bacterium]|nr:GNAT family N-acetyltransferase [Bacillota bacterium]
MRIVDFTHVHVIEATALAGQNYRDAQDFIPALPLIEQTSDLSQFAENNMGIAAFVGDKMVGFLCSVSPFEKPFQMPNVIGAYSPLHANAAVHENRAAIYARMYEAAAEKWAAAGATNHAIVLYAHDTAAQSQLFRYGFGMRGVDAIRITDNIKCSTQADALFTELLPDEFDSVLPLHNLLTEHFWKSPMFIGFTHATKQEFHDMNERQKPRYFAAKVNGQMIAYMKISDSGETFISKHPDIRNICGAFCLPEYRGTGIYKNLLYYVISKFNNEGNTHLGVDFESLNPTASGFWLKHFASYTQWLVRRIDRGAL